MVDANVGIVEFRSENGNLVPLPRKIIEEWAGHIERNNIPRSVKLKDLQESVSAASRIYPHLHKIESHYKPAAFALVEARKSARNLKCHQVVAVGPDWTSNENLLGYPDGLNPEAYIAKPALHLMLQALAHPDTPHFLILDEMNLSHVERYFSDILSAMESGEKISLHGDRSRLSGLVEIAGEIGFPDNIFVIGTVNIDETTYMFSPKVLDRVNVMEFRVNPDELRDFLENPSSPDFTRLDGEGAVLARDFMARSRQAAAPPAAVKGRFGREIQLFFGAMSYHGSEFGYRTIHEASRYLDIYECLEKDGPAGDIWFRNAFDEIVVQKLLPKLHGSRAKLGPILKTLWFLCADGPESRGADALGGAIDAARSSDRRAEPSMVPEVLEATYYALSSNKIARMWRLLSENGFASFAEA